MEKRKVILLCDICLSRNYSFFNGASYGTKLELKKFCSNCNKHCVHKETR